MIATAMPKLSWLLPIGGYINLRGESCMKKFGSSLLVFILMVLIVGCSNSGGNESSNNDINQVNIVAKNSTNVDWVIDKTSYGSENYRGELDAIYAKDFVVKAGEVIFQESSNAKDLSGTGFFAETSKMTYEYKIQLIAGGPMPTDPNEQYVYYPFVAVQDFVIKGTYGETVNIEWDGVEFKQVN
jgi:hypothetical protein